jgi:hypothetical protein
MYPTTQCYRRIDSPTIDSRLAKPGTAKKQLLYPNTDTAALNNGRSSS